MPVVSPSVDAFLVLAAAILLPAVYFFRHQSQPFTLHRALSFLVVFHTLFVLYVIIVRWPPNIFQRLKIPLTASSETIRAVLLQRAGLPPDAPLPRPLETLLTRLTSFDTRTQYVRSLCSISQVYACSDAACTQQIRSVGHPRLRTLHHLRRVCDFCRAAHGAGIRRRGCSCRHLDHPWQRPRAVADVRRRRARRRLHS